jgi:LemA protein
VDKGQVPRVLWENKMKAWILGGIAVLLLFIGIGYVSTYDDINRKDQGVEQTIADVQVDLQRQKNLLPELAAIAERGVQVEIGGLVSIIEARSAIAGVSPSEIARNPELQRQLLESQSDVAGALANIRVVLERYPELRSMALYQTLADETAGSQNRIAHSRQAWNRATAEYNIAVTSFFGRLVAGSTFPERDFYEATAEGQVEMPDLGLPKEE